MEAGRAVALATILGLGIFAGCVTPSELDPQAAGAAPSLDELAAIIGTPIEQLHDHTDPSLHTGAHGLRFVNWSAFIWDELGEEGFAGLRIVGDYAYLATDGAHAGFLIIDVSDPANPTLVSQYSTPGGASQEAVPSRDGNWVFLNLQRQPGAADLAADPTRGTGTGIQIIDVRDKANPTFVSFFPVEIIGTHVMFYTEWQGTPYLIFNGQPLRQSLPADMGVWTPPPGNSVKIAEVVDTPDGGRTLRVVSEFRFTDTILTTTSQGCFPHDQWAEEHPATGQLLMYVSYWDCGAVIVDISDPLTPTLLAHDDEMEPSTRNRIHFFRPESRVRDDGKVYAFSGPEIDISPGEPGYIRAYDVTDPTSFGQIGWWRLPGEVENDKPFLFTPHNFDFLPEQDLMAVAHYHAGVWILDVSDPTNPRHVAWYSPHGHDTEGYDGPEVWRKTPNFPEPYFPNVYEVKWLEKNGETFLMVSERGSGLYVLQLDPTFHRDALPSG